MTPAVRYQVQEPLLHSGQRFAPGDEIELDPVAAAPLLARAALALFPSPGGGGGQARTQPAPKPKKPAK